MSLDGPQVVFIFLISIIASSALIFEFIVEPAYFESYKKAWIDFNATKSCSGLQLFNTNIGSYGMKIADINLMKIAVVQKSKELCK